MHVNLLTVLPRSVSNQFWLTARNVSDRVWGLPCSNFILVILLQTFSSQASSPSLTSRQGSRPRGTFLPFRAAALMSALGALAVAVLSCWTVCCHCQVTIDDQNWSCLETQLLCRVLWSTQTQWSRLAKVPLMGSDQWGASRLSLPIPCRLWCPLCPTRISLRSRKVGDRASHIVPCFMALLENLHLDVWPSKTHFSGMKKLVLRKISLTNHLLTNLPDISGQWQRQQVKVITYMVKEWFKIGCFIWSNLLSFGIFYIPHCQRFLICHPC